MTTKIKPPFRADQVGSLLRPKALKNARAAYAAGTISTEKLREVEDREIKAAISRQDSIGLQAVTDGEFRRSWWHYDFLWHLDGVERREFGDGIQFAGVKTRTEVPFVKSKIGFSKHPFLAHFAFVKASTTAMPKMTIPSPSMLHYRNGRKIIEAALYPDMAAYYADLG